MLFQGGVSHPEEVFILLGALLDQALLQEALVEAVEEVPEEVVLEEVVPLQAEAQKGEAELKNRLKSIKKKNLRI